MYHYVPIVQQFKFVSPDERQRELIRALERAAQEENRRRQEANRLRMDQLLCEYEAERQRKRAARIAASRAIDPR